MMDRVFTVVDNGKSMDMTFAQIRVLAPKDLSDGALECRLYRLRRVGPIHLHKAVEPRQVAKMRTPWRGNRRVVD
jgi:hypothetical protein